MNVLLYNTGAYMPRVCLCQSYYRDNRDPYERVWFSLTRF